MGHFICFSMLSVFLLGILALSDGLFAASKTGLEIISPDTGEIALCIPEPMKEPIYKSVKNLPKTVKVTAKLYNVLKGEFSKKCRLLAESLEELEYEESLLEQMNISHELSKKDRKIVSKMLQDKETGFSNGINILKNLDLHLLGYVAGLQGMLNHEEEITIIELIQSIDLIQHATIELQEFFQLISYLTKAYKNIKNYKKKLHEIRHLFSFKIVFLVNTLGILTEELRGSYLSLLFRGDCSDEQIARALGIYAKKRQAIKREK